jgi:PKD repeat protein
VAEFTGSPTSGVAPLTVDFTNQSSGAITSHAWDFGDGGSSTLASPSHVYTTPGTYTVVLTETGPGGSDARTRVDFVTVAEPEITADFAATPLRGGRPLLVEFFDLTEGDPTAWSWDFGDGTTANTQNPTHVYRYAGLYTVTLTASKPGASDQETKTHLVRVRGPLRRPTF